MDKLKDMIAPTFADSEPVDPFDPEEELTSGSVWSKLATSLTTTSLHSTSRLRLAIPQAVEVVLQQRRSLNEIVNPRRFKSYADLKAKFDQISGAASEPLAVAG